MMYFAALQNMLSRCGCHGAFYQSRGWAETMAETHLYPLRKYLIYQILMLLNVNTHRQIATQRHTVQCTHTVRYNVPDS